MSRVDRIASVRRLKPRSTPSVLQAASGGLLLAIGVGLVAVALAANRSWLDRHFLPSFYLPHRWFVLIHTLVRWALAIVGSTLVLAARSVAARATATAVLGVVRVVIASALALGASELVLQRVHLRPTGWLLPSEEPLRTLDPRLGWRFVPARTGYATIGGRTIEYALDEAGYRVPSLDKPVDPEKPTVLFIGESVMFGEGLTWQESVPAQVGSMLKVQSANLAVHGYSSDQAYLRLQEELPRFRHPAAIVSLFMAALFGRNLDDDRPHLGPGLSWLPAQPHGRLVSLAALLVPYRRDETVEGGIAVTREVLRATVELARARGTEPLFVVPQFGEEAPVERTLRRRILDETDLPYVRVEIDAAWRLAWDRHPNAAAARTIAEAVAARLRQR